MQKEHQYFVYIMSNYKRTVFYVGFTNNLVRRVIEHQHEMGSEFTTKYKLKYLMHYEAYQYVQDAINREKEIKGWRREKKIDLIHENNPEMKDLAQELFDELGITHDEINEIVESIKNRYKL